jgi:hypothetical protein
MIEVHVRFSICQKESCNSTPSFSSFLELLICNWIWPGSASLIFIEATLQRYMEWMVEERRLGTTRVGMSDMHASKSDDIWDP